jgi:hypothetical protein
MRNIDNVLMIAASILLLAVNWLAFHDLREAHTVRDWLTLLASILVVIKFTGVFRNSRKAGRFE